MSNAANSPVAKGPVVKSPVKSALEFALIGFLVFGACLWFLISESQATEISPTHGVMYSLGIAGGLFAHWAYMGVAIRRAGRMVVPWMLLTILTVPIGSVVVGILLASQEEDAAQA